jgi:hypothetical protein
MRNVCESSIEQVSRTYKYQEGFKLLCSHVRFCVRDSHVPSFPGATDQRGKSL